MSIKNYNDSIGNRTRDLPICSAVPQPTAPPRAPSNIMVILIRFGALVGWNFNNIVNKSRRFIRSALPTAVPISLLGRETVYSGVTRSFGGMYCRRTKDNLPDCATSRPTRR